MKKKKTPMPNVIGGYYSDSEFFAMNHEKFVDHCGSQLSVGLLEGEFDQELNSVIAMAVARGMKTQLEIERGIL